MPRINNKNITKACSSILVPLMIGFLTIAVALVQLHVAQKQREQDLNIADQMRWDAVLTDYIKDVSDIFTSRNYSDLKSDSTQRSVLRAKTMMASRQLDVKRKTYLVQFLYDFGALTSEWDLIDLSGAVFDEIDLGAWKSLIIGAKSMKNLSLQSLSLVNASFAFQQLQHANFTFSDLTGVNFHLVQLEDATFRYASLRFANFLGAFCDNVDFFGSDLRGSNIDAVQLQKAKSTSFAILPNGTVVHQTSIIRDGDAESKDICGTTLPTESQLGSWTASPTNSVHVTNKASSMIKALSERVIVDVKSVLGHNHLLVSGYQTFFDTGECSFVVARYKSVSMRQDVLVPKKYQTNPWKYIWLLIASCGELHTNVYNVQIETHFRELNDHNITISEHTIKPRYGPIFEAMFPYNKTTTRASVEVHFNYSSMASNSSSKKDEPWAFCDNIYLSIERL